MSIYNKKNLKILIIGFGSIGKKHFEILKTIKKKEIKILSAQKINMKYSIKLSNLSKYNPDYIIIASKTQSHLKYLNLIEKKFKNKIVLIEKPIFSKKINLKYKNNFYRIGYNLRLHPLIQYLKKKKLKPFFIQANCSSYLPDWRNNIHYSKSNSAQKNGGGVALELSHEIDYLSWLFGDIEAINVFKNKISNLNIKADDIFILNAKIKKKIYCNINLNFFSKIKKREIFIYTKNKNYYGDLNKNILKIYNIKNRTTIRKKFKNINTYKIQHNLMIKKKFQNLCSITEAKKILNILSSK